MADLYDTPKAERTREDVEAHYREQFPVLAAYMDIVAERNHNDGRGINDLFNNPTAVDTVTGAALALERIGRPARDRQDALFAERYIRGLQDEMTSEFPEVELTIVSAVIDALYGFAGSMPTDSEWADFDTQDSDFYLDEVVAGLPDHTDELKRLLGETLKHAMPSILREITERYGANRHGLQVVPTDRQQGVHGVDTPDGERRYTLDELTALLTAAATGAPTLDKAVQYLQSEDTDRAWRVVGSNDGACSACHTSWHNCRAGLHGFLSTGSDGTPAIHDKACICCGQCDHAFEGADLGLDNITLMGLSSLLDLARERQVADGKEATDE